MLDEFCNKLPEATQVALAIRLIEIALQAWEEHLTQHPEDLERINKLITDAHHVRGGAHQVVKALPRAALQELKDTIAAKASIKDNVILRSQLSTIMEPLTLTTPPSWDDILPAPARLAFTAVFNLLTFLILRRKNEDNETTVYVAINQACDCILQKKFLSQPELEQVLQEHKDLQGSPLVGNLQEGEQPPTAPAMSIHTMFASSFREVPANCPLCGSRDVTEEPVHIEFTRMHCNACGNDDLCDCYQLDDWYR